MNVSDTEILLITPPFTQLNTPYPATAYLKGFFNTQNIRVKQADLGIETILKLLTSESLKKIIEDPSFQLAGDENSKRIYSWRDAYFSTIDAVVNFLQNNNPTLAYRIAERNFLPEASRFTQAEDMEYSFGNMGIQDQARYLCTLYLEDVSDFISSSIDPHFGFSRYAERLGRSAYQFDEIYDLLKQPLSPVEKIYIAELDRLINHSFESKKQETSLVCFSVPFPGNLFSAFRCAQHIKKRFPGIKTAMGGGFANTELRSVSDIRVFEFFDFITLDDGERPLLNLFDYIHGNKNKVDLKRTFLAENGKVVFYNSDHPDFSLRQWGTPDYSDLPLKKYLSVIEITNPMHRLWSDGRWNKLTLAHGCYWGKCSFCDVSLDYIQRYEPIQVKTIADRIEELIKETGETGFHFVDEAAPPSLLKELALEIIRRNIKITWWTNIRFEKNFTADLCRLMFESGCIAVSGGLEVASDRLLKLIEKGVSVDQVAVVTNSFTNAGIKVHAYLMYGYPTQTVQETIDSLELVRQLFEIGIIQSGFWHRFALTVHSPVAKNPDKYGIKILTDSSKAAFALNDLEFIENQFTDHDVFADGLRISLYNFMNETGFDLPLQHWFDTRVPKTKVKKEYIEKCISQERISKPLLHQKCVWTGGFPEIDKGKKHTWLIHAKKEVVKINFKMEESNWLQKVFPLLLLSNEKLITVAELEKSYYETTGNPFALFTAGTAFEQLRANGLLFL
jgi:radical SAM superfamily enzyme YgiQ (UPF0313 family)